VPFVRFGGTALGSLAKLADSFDQRTGKDVGLDNKHERLYRKYLARP